MAKNIYDLFPEVERPPGYKKPEPPKKRRNRLLLKAGIVVAGLIATGTGFQYYMNKDRSALLLLLAGEENIDRRGFAVHLKPEVAQKLRAEARNYIRIGKNGEKSQVLPNAFLEYEVDCQTQDNVETCITTTYAIPVRPLVNPEDRKRLAVDAYATFPVRKTPKDKLGLQ